MAAKSEETKDRVKIAVVEETSDNSSPRQRRNGVQKLCPPMSPSFDAHTGRHERANHPEYARRCRQRAPVSEKVSRVGSTLLAGACENGNTSPHTGAEWRLG